MKIFLERAKDNNFTCTVESSSSKKIYVYSKYRPMDVRIGDIEEDKSYIVLGLGLGYEVNFIANNTSGNIYVIEPNKEFYNIILENEELKELITNKNIIFLFGEAYKNVTFDGEDKIINNDNITKHNNYYFIEVLNYINGKAKKNKPTVIVFNHVTIAHDCMEGLKNIGYKVVSEDFYKDLDRIKMKIVEGDADYVFTINFNKDISNICNELNVPYISWCVDTPQYGIYNKEILNKNNYIFLYEETMAQDLRKIGVKNAYYMPVAANIERFRNIVINKEDIEKYSCDISFVGSLTISEYTEKLKDLLSDGTKNIVNQMIERQNRDISNFLLKEMCTDKLVNIIQKEARCVFNPPKYLSNKDMLAYYLGREQSFQERIFYMNEIKKNFDINDIRVYGNNLWNNFFDNYYGLAEHFTVMPKIMKLSKINLNITRTFVESGLPMRVFDVLGSGGFLLTNHKKGLDYKFEKDKDYVLYRDIQDLMDMAKYYLNHEKERREIANHGYETVKKHHTYEIRLEKMMEIVNFNNKLI